jgi:Arc/MetJ-type ribon-helix-helix transcriptional regulator
MEVRLTPDQEAFVREAVAEGRFQRPEDAVAEALSLWEEREPARTEILAAFDRAEGSIERGEDCIVTEQSMRQLSDQVKQRGRARLLSEQKSIRSAGQPIQTAD